MCLAQNFSAETKYSVPSVSAKYSVSGATLKTAWKIPQTELNQNPDFFVPAWGLAIDFFNFFDDKAKSAPFSVVAGTVTPSGAISRLKKPSLSSSTVAIRNSFSDASMLFVPLPGASNCEKPLALSTSLKIKTDSPVKKINVTLYSNEKNDFLESALIQLKTGKKSHISFSTTAGQFVKSNTTSKWFSATRLFPETQFFATNYQASLITPWFKTLETVNLFYEQIFFSGPQATFSSENQLKLKHFLLNFSFFCISDKEIFTASSTRQKTLGQIKINPAITAFPLKNLKTQFGALCLLEQKIQSDEQIRLEKKLSGQINFYTKNTFSKLIISAEGIDSAEKISGSFCHNLYRLANPSETVSFTFAPKDNKLKLKFGQKISFNKKNCSGSFFAGTTSVIINDKIDSLRTEIKMSCQAKTKRLSVSASAGLFFNIL